MRKAEVEVLIDDVNRDSKVEQFDGGIDASALGGLHDGSAFDVEFGANTDGRAVRPYHLIDEGLKGGFEPPAKGEDTILEEVEAGGFTHAAIGVLGKAEKLLGDFEDGTELLAVEF